jgi:hypothetical protein
MTKIVLSAYWITNNHWYDSDLEGHVEDPRHMLTPLLQWKILLGTPLRRMEEEAESRIILVQLIHLAGKPNFFMMARMVPCSMVSKAFSKSSFRITISLFEW